MANKNREARFARQRARQRQQRLRALAFGIIGVVVLGLAGYLLVSAFFQPAPPAMAGNVIDVQADMAGFDNKEIRVQVGEPVTVRLTSLDNSMHTDGGGKHQWAVDELGVSIVAPPEGSNYATFTPHQPGTYTYYCDICCGGRANPTMQGTLIVEG
jgi:heme/copper-type cytochrome/quinol oxidase subunit 2